MFDTIAALSPPDPDYSPRTARLALYKKVQDGTLYDLLPHAFQDERTASGEYIPLRSRRPSVRYPLARIVVDDSVSLVFSDGHFPTLDSDDVGLRSTLSDLAIETRLNSVMQEAALRGAVGSVAVLLRVLKGRIFLKVLESLYLNPVWDPEAPDTLLSVTEKYKAAGSSLVDLGYQIDNPAAQYWFMRIWDSDRETWFHPWPTTSVDPPMIDALRSISHGLGFVPLVWTRNLPGGPDGAEGIDGACTFRPAIETAIEIDYQLSQAGRGLKYSSDPTLLIREPAGDARELVRGGGNALVVTEHGDARLLEINGTASAAVIEYIRTLRELALEGVHGNRASADRLTTAQSGRALEMMNQGLIFLADNLRVSYGAAILQIARMIISASHIYRLTTHHEPVPPLDRSARLRLKWPRWYAPDASDRAADAQTLATLTTAKLLSPETALRSIADIYAVPDIGLERAKIAATEPDIAGQETV
jgi:hypothetical protein